MPLWLIRFLGMTFIALIGCFLLFGLLGEININPALPWKKMVHISWPDLPFFASWKVSRPDGKEEVIYRVPSRQLSPGEIARLKIPATTNAAPSAAAR